MREKLLNLMRSEGLTSSRLAELLGIQPSGISHILSGRNKPSFDFVQKILRRFPNINPDWLLLDSGPMYRDTPEGKVSPPAETITPTLPLNDLNAPGASQTSPSGATTVEAAAAGTPDAGMTSPLAAATARHGKVKRIIVLFDDHTFESYSPS